MASVTILFGAWSEWAPVPLNIALALTGVLLIGLVLIQRGKGGGLAGAFGGAGGSSAFGSRAGDTFTKVTIYLALFWIFLIMGLIKTIQPTTPLRGSDNSVESRDQEQSKDVES
jgi:preprotein translocase subunit SecG